MPLVTLAQAAELLEDTGASYSAIRRWRDDGRLTSRGAVDNGKKNMKAFLYDFEEVKKLAEEMMRIKNGDIPDGYIDIREAVSILGISFPKLAYRALKGQYQAKKVSYGVVRKKWVFLRTAVLDDAPVSAPRLHVDTFPARPLISYRDNECIAARRELFERAGRVLNLKNALARSRAAG